MTRLNWLALILIAAATPGCLSSDAFLEIPDAKRSDFPGKMVKPEQFQGNISMTSENVVKSNESVAWKITGSSGTHAWVWIPFDLTNNFYEIEYNLTLSSLEVNASDWFFLQGPEAVISTPSGLAISGINGLASIDQPTDSIFESSRSSPSNFGSISDNSEYIGIFVAIGGANDWQLQLDLASKIEDMAFDLEQSEILFGDGFEVMVLPFSSAPAGATVANLEASVSVQVDSRVHFQLAQPPDSVGGREGYVDYEIEFPGGFAIDSTSAYGPTTINSPLRYAGIISPASGDFVASVSMADSEYYGSALLSVFPSNSRYVPASLAPMSGYCGGNAC